MEVCVKRGDLPYYLPCVKIHEVKPEDTCGSIISNRMDIDPDVDLDVAKLQNIIKFYTLNVLESTVLSPLWQVIMKRFASKEEIWEE